jgi:hypothetical protein
MTMHRLLIEQGGPLERPSAMAALSQTIERKMLATPY